MGKSTGNADTKSTKTGQNDKTKEKPWDMLGEKGKRNTRKNNITTYVNKPKVQVKEGRLKIPTKLKTIKTKQDIPKH